MWLATVTDLLFWIIERAILLCLGIACISGIAFSLLLYLAQRD